jgi:hypothetical protein
LNGLAGGAAAPDRGPIELSLAISTRAHRRALEACLGSLVRSLARPDRVEVLLGVDTDDDSVDGLRWDEIQVRIIRLTPRLIASRRDSTLAAAAEGRWVMLLNDDLEFAPEGWDRLLLERVGEAHELPTLVHVSDGVLDDQLCIYPCVSKRTIEVMGSIHTLPYRRWWADDHLHNIFYLLGRIGYERIVRIPEICFLNDFGRRAKGIAVEIPAYSAAFKKEALEDQALFINSVGLRRELALELARAIDPAAYEREHRRWRAMLERLPNFRRQTLYHKWPRKLHRRLFWPILKHRRADPSKLPPPLS